MHVNQFKNLVATELKEVDQLIEANLGSKISLIQDINRYIVGNGGKRIRPLILLLGAKASGEVTKGHLQFAAVIEYIHTATLLHDDVVDNSEMRRSRPTANQLWGNEAAVLTGDFLYSKAFQMMVDIGDLPSLNIISTACTVMAEGEALQLFNRHNPMIDEKQYYTIIEQKTAKLFEAACLIAGTLSQIDPNLIQVLGQYGMELGKAFQLIDDILDYDSPAKTLGKNPGDDLAEGKLTLPLIYLLKNGTANEIEMTKKAIRQGDLSLFSQVQTAIKSSGAIDYTLQKAHAARDNAKHCAYEFPPSPARDTLMALADFAVSRKN